jgi:hypothetical protein
LLQGQEDRPDRWPAERLQCQELQARQRPEPQVHQRPVQLPAEPELQQAPPQAWLVEPKKRQRKVLRPE